MSNATAEHTSYDGKLLGIGIYSPAEAAFYARVNTQTMSRWIFGDSKGQPVVESQIPADGEKIVTFLDFVQALAIRAIRIQFKIPLPKIRAAVEKARVDFGVQYPLAMPHKTFVFSDQKRLGHGELIIRLDGEHGEKLVQLSGKKSGNLVIREVVELFMDDVSRDANGLASEYKAWGDGDRRITMNPLHRFGEPIVEPCGYTAQTLWEASIAEGGLEAAAEAYGVDREDVALACSYYDHLQSPTAA